MKFYFFENYTSRGDIAVGHIIGAVSRLNAYNILRRRFGRRFGELIQLYEVGSVEKLRASKQYIITAQKTPPRGAIVEKRR